MKKIGSIICVVLLLFVGLSITPAMGSIQKADVTEQPIIRCAFETEDMVTIDFVDCTGGVPVKKEVKLLRSEWMDLRNELRSIRRSSESSIQLLNAQFSVLKKYDLVSDDFSFEDVVGKKVEKFNSLKRPRFFDGARPTPLSNNYLFNTMCAIDFELTNGTTAVLGLNTFLNYMGFDILSFHHGYALDGIDTKGVISANTPPGEYVGFMFGFLGYWLGEKIGTGFYSNVTVAGFTVVTAWLSIPVFP